jgi:hypothetical protein
VASPTNDARDAEPRRDSERVRTHRTHASVSTEHTVLLAERDQFGLELIRDEEATGGVDAFSVSLDFKTVPLAPVQALAMPGLSEEPSTESLGLLDAFTVRVVLEVLERTPHLGRMIDGADAAAD